MTAAGTGGPRPGIVDELRRTVAGMIEEEPGSIADDANLFELGLDSIAMMRLVNGWRRAGVEIGFAELAERPFLAAWTELLGGRDRAAPSTADPTDSTDPDDDDGAFPLALMQHAYWLGRDHGRHLGGVAAHLYVEFETAPGRPGADPDRLRAALDALAARHDMLRAEILDDGRQRIRSRPGGPGPVVHDLSGATDDGARAELDAVRDAWSHQRLDIAGGQVFAAALSVLPSGVTRLHVDVDMVAADAVSYRILLADLARLYAGPAPLPELGYDYRRYRAAHAASRRDATARAAAWWRDRLDDLPGAPDLPLADRPGPDGDARPRVRRLHLVLDGDRRARLAATARDRGLTLAVVMATAFAETIGGWSGQPRFLVNVPLFDREPLHPDVDRLVGDFTGSVLLDVDLRAPASFAGRARQLQERLHADAAHADFSGVDVLRELTRRRGEQVLAPIVFTSALSLGELFDETVRQCFGDPVWIVSQGPQVLLDAQVTEVAGGLLVNWDVRDGELADGVVDAMFDAFSRLVHRLADDGPAWDAAVTGLPPASQRAVRDAVNDTARPRAAGRLHDGFFRQRGRTPGAPAVLSATGGTWSYDELADRSLRFAAALAGRGVRPGDPVGITLPKGPDQIAAVLGVLAAGGVYVPVGVEQPPARAARIAAQAGFRVLIGGPGGLTPAEAYAAEPAAGPVDGSADDLAYLLFTSGSTGEPKGVEVPHRAAAATVGDLVERFGIGPHDRTLAVSALDFDLSVFDVFAPLSVGGAVVLVDQDDRRDAQHWVALVREHRVTVLNCVPVLLDMLLVAGGLGDSLRVVLLGGDRVGVDLPARLAAAVPGCRFAGLGGTTETAIHSTVCEVGPGGVDPAWRCVPYGTPLSNVRCRVVDTHGRDCPDHVPGELWIGGDGVARGYRGDPERTADRFVTHDGLRWYRTGDLARYRPDGVIEFLGRRDDQLKIRGFRIEPGEIEAALLADDRVRAAAVTTGGDTAPTLLAGVVLAAPDQAGTERAGTERAGAERAGAEQVGAEEVGAEQVGAEQVGAEQVGAIRERLAERLPAHMLPDRLVVLDALPLTANGKVDRAAVRAAAGTGPADVRREPPRGPVEAAVAAVWREVLGLPDVGVHDELLSLGADSVLATTIVARLRATLDTSSVSVRMLFAAPTTVAGLAARMLAAGPDPDRLTGIAEIAAEIAGLSDDEVEAELGAGPDPEGATR